MRFTPLFSALLAGTLLTGCSAFEPDYYKCDSRITSFEQGARATLTSQNTNQIVEVRFNGVSGLCYDDDGDIQAEVGIGLKVLRDLTDGVDVAPVVVPMMAAVLDSDDNVIETSSFVYTMQFTDGSPVIYPLVRRDFTLPADGRLILSLTPELVIQP